MSAFKARNIPETTVSAAAGGTHVLPANRSRDELLLSVSGEAVRFTCDGTAPSATHGIPVADGSAYILTGGAANGRVRAWCAGGTAKLNGYESVPSLP